MRLIASIQGGHVSRSIPTLAGLIATIATAASLLGPGAAPAEAGAAVASSQIAKPTCPAGHARVRYTSAAWRGWYGCVRRGRNARPTGCRPGYRLETKRRGGRRAFRCRLVPPPAPTPPAPPNTPPQPPPAPQQTPTSPADDRLLRLAFDFAVQIGAGDIRETQESGERTRYSDWWLNANVHNGVFHPQIYPIGHRTGDRQWAEGCMMIGAHARCTLVQLEYNAIPDSSLLKYMAVRRKYVWALNYEGGIQYRYVWKPSDDPSVGPWYYLCVGPPQVYSNIPACTY
jgi:hypothetical protein